MSKEEIDRYAEHLQTLEMHQINCCDCGKELSKAGYIIDKKLQVRCRPCYRKKYPQEQK